MRKLVMISVLSFNLIAACGEDGEDGNGSYRNGTESSPINPGKDAAAPSMPDPDVPDAESSVAPDPGTLHELFGHDWTVEPSVEAYYCGYKTLKEDLYISRFKPHMPPGTHHLVIGYQDPALPDGYLEADPNEQFPAADKCTGVTFGDVFAYVATVGTQELVMPEGVAVKIPKGKQLVFGLHVFNTTSKPLSGHSSVDVIAPERSEVENVAEVIAAQNTAFAVPPGRSTVTATCTMVDDTTVFAVLPHMHLAGRHMTTIAEIPGQEPITLYDQPYDFTDQRYARLDPEVHLPKGATINVACDYENLGDADLTPGESTTMNEMCISFVYRYPALLSDDTPLDNSLGRPAPRSWCLH
jgi:hypothetical protein